ncbi:MAG: hypothetical protein ABSB40_03505 [Nitrososphaeria archaeon]|jgi:predicted RNA binding protein with dsRBD fold (UPF0201 family)
MIPKLEIKIKVQISAVLNASEDVGKLSAAIKSVAGNVEPSNREESDNLLVWEFDGINALYNFYSKIRERKITAAARRLILKNMRNDSTWVYLNRQAASVGNIVLCDDPEESPLGPLVLKFESPLLMEVVDWLTGEKEMNDVTKDLRRRL